MDVVRIKVYLAGPDVFLPDAEAHGKRLKEILAEAGLEGLFPLDNEIKASSPAETAAAIRNANISMIKECDAVIANLAPFRGAEPDSGTVWETGYAQALGKQVIGYCETAGTLHEKTVRILELPEDADRDRDGLAIENFGLSHNLMFADIVTAGSFEEAVQMLRVLL